uniref:Phospholipase A-2-activating protein n=1 Tax=Ascaris suum TaxID=6253 RepID=F1KVN1_ASCSU
MASRDEMEVSGEGGGSFMLSCVIPAHGGDVKSLAGASPEFIVSGSRDGSAKLFSQRLGRYSEVLSVMKPSKMAVNAVAMYQSSEGWLIFVGRKDGAIAVFMSGHSDPIRLLHQHDSNVSALHVDSVNKVIISGSWDCKAIVWPISGLTTDEGFNALGLVGHTMSVWAVSSIVDMPGYYLTGSADLTIKFWKDDIEIHSFTGHNDVVRSIISVSVRRFLSAANDSTIRLWDLIDKTCLEVFSSASGEYIYSMALIPNEVGDMLASCGESGFLELWNMKEGGHLQHEQILSTPAQSTWCVLALTNGDIATGADNGNVYIFTRNEERKADRAQLEAFDEGVAQKLCQDVVKVIDDQDTVKITVQVGDGSSNMVLTYKKGTDPAEAAQAFIMENDLPPAYLDEIVEYIKKNVVEARGVQSKEDAAYDNKKWDYTLDVQTSDGRMLKLHYNTGEDTYFAAQRFVEKYNLPYTFLPKVSAMLQSQMPGAAATSDRVVPTVDPYTGGDRYVPGAETQGGSTAADPFTGSGRYIPSSAGFTAHESDEQDRKRPRWELVPLREYYRFGIEMRSGRAMMKLKEFNEMHTEYRLTEQQVKALEEIMTHATFGVGDMHLSALDVGLQWGLETVLPIVDAFRLGLLNRQLNKIYCSMIKEDGNEPRGAATLQKLIGFLTGDTPDNIRVLVCRAFANAVVHKWGCHMLLSDLSTSVSALLAQLTKTKAPLQLAASSALANFALMLLKHTESEEIDELGPREDMIMLTIKSLKNAENFNQYSEATHMRVLQTLVTLIWGDVALIKSAKAQGIVAIVNRMRDVVADERVKAIARDIVEMTYAV